MMGIQAIEDLMQALHNRLSTHLAVQNALGDPARLYDSPPEDPVFPYMTYGPMRAENRSGDGVTSYKHSLSLHLWSQYAGRWEVLEMVEAISDALEDMPLSLPSGQDVVVTHTYLDVLRASDGRTYHGLLRLNLYTLTEEGDP